MRLPQVDFCIFCHIQLIYLINFDSLLLFFFCYSVARSCSSLACTSTVVLFTIHSNLNTVIFVSHLNDLMSTHLHRPFFFLFWITRSSWNTGFCCTLFYRNNIYSHKYTWHQSDGYTNKQVVWHNTLWLWREKKNNRNKICDEHSTEYSIFLKAFDVYTPVMNIYICNSWTKVH